MEINKKGYTSMGLIYLIFVALFLMIILIVLSYGMGLADNAFSEIEIELGNASFQETYNETLKKGITSMETTFPQIISNGVLLGMVLCLVLVGYITRGINKIWIILDILIIIVAEYLAILIRKSFVSFIGLTPEFLEISRDILGNGAKYILNLPIIIPTIGVLIMLSTYFLAKEREVKIF